MRDRVIDALDVVRAELGGKRTLRACGPRKHEEAARVAVEAMHHAERRVAATELAQQRARAVGERVPVARLVGNAQHPRGLVDDDDVAVEKHDRARGQRSGPKLGRPLVDRHGGFRRNTCCRIDAALAVHRDAPVDAQAARTRPGGARPLAHDRGDRRIESLRARQVVVIISGA